MQVFVTFSLLAVLWAIYGYSLAFTNGNAFFGGFDRLFLAGMLDAAGNLTPAATFSKGVYIPEYLYAAFQMTFAAITPCLIVGAFAERMKFSAMLVFMVLWFTFSYLPIAHMVWWWAGPDAYTDAAAATAATCDRRLPLPEGRARLRGRHGGAHQRRHRRPGGLHPGRQAQGLRHDGHAAAQRAADHDRRRPAVGGLVRLQRRLEPRVERVRRARCSSTPSSPPPPRCCAWTFAEWIFRGTPTMLGAASGAVAGLVAITPACGWVGPMGAIVIGLLAGVVCLFAVTKLKSGPGLRRLAGRVRRPLRRRHPRRHPDGRVQRPLAGRHRHL